MNAALFTKSTTGVILASSLIAATSILGHAQDAPFALGAQATNPLSGWYMTTPTGQATLGGHTFDMTSGNFIALANGGSASFTGSYQSPKAVHLLLNTSNTYGWYAGSVVGTVVVTFSDGTSQSTDLTVGANLREWRTGAAGVVNTVTDTTPSLVTAYTAEAWKTTAQPSMGGGTAVLDELTVPVLAANASKTLTGVTLTDTNGWGNLQMQLSGLTADFTPPAPPAPAPTPTPTTCGKDDNAGGTHPAHPGLIEKNADKNCENVDKTDSDKTDKEKPATKPVVTKPVVTKPADKKPVVKKTDKSDKSDKSDKETGNHDRHGND
jgi:hypothetical protein